MTDWINRFKLSLCLKIALGRRNCSTTQSVITTLKPKQADCLIELGQSDGKDVLAILPTGYGKSLVFELLPLVYEACERACGHMPKPCSTIVVSPLNSIISEQAERYGEAALVMTSEAGNHDLPSSSSLHNLKTKHFSYILGHPEQFVHKSVIDILGGSEWQRKAVFIVIDEAHCVVKWGPQFRTGFQNLYKVKAAVTQAKVLAMTATATRDLRTELVRSLHMKTAVVIMSSVNRPNIKLVGKRRLASTGKTTVEMSYEEIFQPLIHNLKERKQHFPKTVVYTRLKWCGYGHEMAVRKERDGSPSMVSQFVGQFHKPCTKEMKEQTVGAMQDGRLRLLFASEAYSMGTDVSDIRHIVHAGPPHCLETYLQEVGRAGRDGLQALATLYFNASDISAAVTTMSQDMREFCTANKCRREFLCDKFDSICNKETQTQMHLCCDVCEAQCRCAMCSGEDDDVLMPDATGQPEIDSVKKVLLDYFHNENQISEVPTGLTAGLAHDLAVNFHHFGSSDAIKLLFHLEDCYAKNIYIILQSMK